MRRFATSLFLVILASLIFYGGAGVNFVSYCCGVCEKEGVEALLEAKCCEIHGHDHSRDKLANNTVECWWHERAVALNGLILIGIL